MSVMTVKVSTGKDKSRDNVDGLNAKVEFEREVPDTVQGWVDEFGEKTIMKYIQGQAKVAIAAVVRPALNEKDLFDNFKNTDEEAIQIGQDYVFGTKATRKSKDAAVLESVADAAENNPELAETLAKFGIDPSKFKQ